MGQEKINDSGDWQPSPPPNKKNGGSVSKLICRIQIINDPDPTLNLLRKLSSKD